MKFKFVIWGVGFRGKTIAQILGTDQIEAFIESNPKLIGLNYLGKPIISAVDYEIYFKEYMLIISPLHYENILSFAKKAGINHYFILNEECSELMGYGCNHAVDKIVSTLNINHCYVIYGINLFALLLYQHLYNKGVEKLYLVASDNKQKYILSNAFLTKYKIHLVSFETVSELADKIFVTRSKDKPFYKKNCGNIKFEQMYDLSLKIYDYYNPEVEQLKDKHSNERCFIVATGSSMKPSDLEQLRSHREITISMNRIYKFFEQTKWRPNYYVFIDRRGISIYEEEIKQLDLDYLLIGDGSEDFWKDYHKENTYKIHVTHTNSDSDTLAFSDTCEHMVYGGSTVTYVCLQVAVYLGFKDIYLLGVDCDYSQGKGSSYFFPGYVKEGTSQSSYDLRENLSAYSLAKEYADAHNIKIYNATRGGKLEVFERVDFDSLF